MYQKLNSSFVTFSFNFYFLCEIPNPRWDFEIQQIAFTNILLARVCLVKQVDLGLESEKRGCVWEIKDTWQPCQRKPGWECGITPEKLI